MGYFFGFEDSGVFLALIALAFMLLPLSLWSGHLRDRMLYG